MDKLIYSIEEIGQKLKPIFVKNNIHKAILFGSYAKSKVNENSDIDLVVDSKMKGLKFVGLLDEITETLGKDIDLFDVTHIEKNSQIAKEITQTGILIYEK